MTTSTAPSWRSSVGTSGEDRIADLLVGVYAVGVLGLGGIARSLVGDLRGVVVDTVGPSTVSLWLAEEKTR